MIGNSVYIILAEGWEPKFISLLFSKYKILPQLGQIMDSIALPILLVNYILKQILLMLWTIQLKIYFV